MFVFYWRIGSAMGTLAFHRTPFQLIEHPNRCYRCFKNCSQSWRYYWAVLAFKERIERGLSSCGTVILFWQLWMMCQTCWFVRRAQWHYSSEQRDILKGYGYTLNCVMHGAPRPVW